MFCKSVTLVLGLITLSTTSFQVSASECPSYDKVTAKLSSRYREQRVFTGFANKTDQSSAAAIYEFWSNPEQGNWSLVAQKLVQFQYEGQQVTKNCTFIINAGKKHHLATARPAANDDIEVSSETDDHITAAHNASCIPRSQLAQALDTRYNEIPVLQALANDSAMVEIYGSENSWTITRAKVQEVKNLATGTALRDVKTGQEIRQLCATPAFSGKDWGVFTIEKDFI